MIDLFNTPSEVFYSERFDNFMIIHPATIFMFATAEGSEGRKLCVDKTKAIKEYKLIFVGTL